MGEEAEHRKEAESVPVLADRHAVGEEDAHPVLYLSRGQAEAASGGQLKKIMGEWQGICRDISPSGQSG